MAALIIGSVSPVAASLVVKQLGYKSASLLSDPDRLGELLPQLDSDVDLVFVSVPDGVEFIVKPYEVAAYSPRKAYILVPARIALLAHTAEIALHPSAQELGYDQLFSFELKDAASLAQILAHHPESSDLIFQVTSHIPGSNYALQRLDLPGYGGRRVYQLDIASSPPPSPAKVVSKPISEADLWSEEMRSRGLIISFASFRKLTSDGSRVSSLARLVPEDKRGNLDEMKGKASVYQISTNEMARLLIFFLGISSKVECTFTAERDLTVAVDGNLECILQHHGDDLNYLLKLYIGSLDLKLDVGDIIQYASSDEIYNWMIGDLERADGLISLDYPSLDDIDGVLIPKFEVPSTRFPIDYWLDRAFSSPETKHRCFVTLNWSLGWKPIKGTPPKPLEFDDRLTVDEQAIPRKKAPSLPKEAESPDAGSDFDIYSDDEEEEVPSPERESGHFYREKSRTVLSATVDGRIYYIHFIQGMLSNRPAPSYEKIVAAMKSGDHPPSFLAIDNRNLVGILSRE